MQEKRSWDRLTAWGRALRQRWEHQNSSLVWVKEKEEEWVRRKYAFQWRCGRKGREYYRGVPTGNFSLQWRMRIRIEKYWASEGWKRLKRSAGANREGKFIGDIPNGFVGPWNQVFILVFHSISIHWVPTQYRALCLFLASQRPIDPTYWIVSWAWIKGRHLCSLCSAK